VRIVLVLLLVACAKPTPEQHVDLDLIKIVGEARMRTDTVGEGKFAEVSSFVLVDAENASGTGAYITLAGAFTDASGAAVGTLKPQSIWIPSHDVRTFALVDVERKPRPTATSAKIEVRGALIASPPRARIADIKTFPQDGLIALQASLVNEADRTGRILVLASFHDKEGRPLSRPFTLLEVPGKGTAPLQFVGPPGSVVGAIYIGEETY
jgi:hypothetical protein